MAHCRGVLRGPLSALVVAGLAASAAPAAASESLYPDPLLVLGEGRAGHALLVEKDTEKLFLYRSRPEQPPELVRTWNATTGKNGGDKTLRGDHRTPEGIYFFTQFLEDRELPAEYGARAIVMDYPNLFDRRAGKTGDGIWLHATDEIVRPLTSNQTRGCVVVTSHDVLEISKYVVLRETPIVVQERVRRIDRATFERERHELLALVEGWRRSWAAGNFERFAAAYAARFRSDDKDRGSWLAAKAAVARESGTVEIEALRPTVLRDHDQAIIRFGQLYRSELRADYGRKTLWLEKEAGQWRIIAEDWQVATPPAAVAARVTPIVRAVATSRPAETPAPEPVLVASIAPETTVMPAPPARPEPGRGAAAAAEAPVQVRDFLADLGPSEMRVSFRLERTEPEQRAAQGWVAVVARVKTPGGTRLLAWPGQVRLQRGEPLRPDAGDWYSIRRFKVVDARLPDIPHGSELEQVSLHVFDARGRRLTREVFGN